MREKWLTTFEDFGGMATIGLEATETLEALPKVVLVLVVELLRARAPNERPAEACTVVADGLYGRPNILR
jgi:hypothetical protein